MTCLPALPDPPEGLADPGEGEIGLTGEYDSHFDDFSWVVGVEMSD
jgi:hypothetical protein